jgi:hypothetical protein
MAKQMHKLSLCFDSISTVHILLFFISIATFVIRSFFLICICLLLLSPRLQQPYSRRLLLSYLHPSSQISAKRRRGPLHHTRNARYAIPDASRLCILILFIQVGPHIVAICCALIDNSESWKLCKFLSTGLPNKPSRSKIPGTPKGE